MAAYTTIDYSEAYFQAKLYTGDGSAITPTFDGETDMIPAIVWFKAREGSVAHNLTTSVIGVQKYFRVNETDGEVSDANSITAFSSDGFSAVTSHTIDGTDYVAWCWKAGTTSGINATGADITPGAYSFDQTAGISIIKYTGNSTTDQQVAHGLGAVPHFIICKVVDADNAQNWDTYHHKNTAAPETDYLSLNLTNATADAAARWQDTVPTSVLFTVGDAGAVNQTGDSILAFCFTSIQGYSKFSGFTGNGNADSTFVYTGFRPAWIMIKRTDGANGWVIYDNKRQGYNINNDELFADEDSAEVTTDDRLLILSNGFKPLSASQDHNGNGSAYIYAAFAEAPLVNSEGVPCNAR